LPDNHGGSNHGRCSRLSASNYAKVHHKRCARWRREPPEFPEALGTARGC